MLYKNKNNGRVIDVNSEMSGAWEPVKAPTKPKVETPKEETPNKKGTKK